MISKFFSLSRFIFQSVKPMTPTRCLDNKNIMCILSRFWGLFGILFRTRLRIHLTLGTRIRSNIIKSRCLRQVNFTIHTAQNIYFRYSFRSLKSNKSYQKINKFKTDNFSIRCCVRNRKSF